MAFGPKEVSGLVLAAISVVIVLAVFPTLSSSANDVSNDENTSTETAALVDLIPFAFIAAVLLGVVGLILVFGNKLAGGGN